MAKPAERAPSRFAGFKPKPAADRAVGDRAPSPAPAAALQRQELTEGVRGYTRAFADMERLRRDGLPVLPHQHIAFKLAETALWAASPEAAQDLRSALSRQRGLAGRVDQPGGLAAIGKAMAHEGQVRRDPQLRAERFVESWTRLKTQHAELSGWQNTDARRKVEARMRGLAGGLARDPQVESVLAGRRLELDLSPGEIPGRNLVQDLTCSQMDDAETPLVAALTDQGRDTLRVLTLHLVKFGPCPSRHHHPMVHPATNPASLWP